MRHLFIALALTLIAAQLAAAPVPEDHRDVYIYHGRRSSNLIALTYDDGPNATYTPQLMQMLTELDCPATFYLLGDSCQGNPRTTQALCDSNFELGNHSMSHANFRGLEREQVDAEVDGVINIVEEKGGTTPTLRPPYGRSNRTVVEEVYGERDMDIIMWSLDTNDWQRDRSADQMIQQILDEAQGGEIILMHDRSQKVLDTTAAIIPALRERGFEFVTVSAMLEDLRNPPAEEENAEESAQN